MAKKFLSASDILGAVDIVSEDVEVAEWGGWVRVQGLTGAQRDAFEAGLSQRKGKKVTTSMENIRARLVAASAVDEAGRPLFSDEDVAALGKKSAAGLDRVFSVAMRLSGLSESDVDDLAENFTNGQSEDFSSS